MFKKILLKFMFRAVLSLAVVVGLASFTLHSMGGDPMAILKQVGGGVGQQVAKMGSSAGDKFSAATSKTQSALRNGKKGGSDSQQLYRWKDANGVTHFSSEPPPEGQQAESLEVRANRNVLATPKPVRDAYAPPKRELEEQPMPGMAGIAQRSADPKKLIQQFVDLQKSRSQQIP